jgi:hypothetical protein
MAISSNPVSSIKSHDWQAKLQQQLSHTRLESGVVAIHNLVCSHKPIAAKAS